MYDESYDPYTEENKFNGGKDATHGIFTEAYLTKFPQFAAPQDAFNKSGGKCRLWMTNPVIFTKRVDTAEKLFVLYCRRVPESG